MFYVITVITTIVRILKIKKQNLNKLALPSDITDWKKYIFISGKYRELNENQSTINFVRHDKSIT